MNWLCFSRGRTEQMSEYIKRLIACIRWYVELENCYLAEQEKLQAEIDSENTRHADSNFQCS